MSFLTTLSNGEIKVIFVTVVTILFYAIIQIPYGMLNGKKKTGIFRSVLLVLLMPFITYLNLQFANLLLKNYDETLGGRFVAGEVLFLFLMYTALIYFTKEKK